MHRLPNDEAVIGVTLAGGGLLHKPENRLTSVLGSTPPTSYSTWCTGDAQGGVVPKDNLLVYQPYPCRNQRIDNP